MKSSIAILGATGFLGSRAVESLLALGGHDVVAASRRAPRAHDDRATARTAPWLHVDIENPRTYSALEGCSVVVDVANSSKSDPVPLAMYCTQRAITYLSASSDAPLMNRLRAAFAGKCRTKGRVVLGAGIFTGLSNLLAARAVRALPSCDSIALGICSSPLSASGSGTVDLMTDALVSPSIVYRDGMRIEGPPVTRHGRVAFAPRARVALVMPFAEADMLHWSLGIPNVTVAFAPRPALLRVGFQLTPAFVLRSRLFRWLLGAIFVRLRTRLLAERGSEVQLVATARDSKAGTSKTLRLIAPDGMHAGAQAIAAMAVAVASRAEPPQSSGGWPQTVTCIDEAVDFDHVIAEMNAIQRAQGRPGDPLRIEQVADV